MLPEDDDGPFTYRKLKEALSLMTEAQLDQEVQLLPNNPTPEPTRLQPVYGINTVEHYEAEDTRSTVDFEHHPEQVVMLTDYSPFDKDGNNFFIMEEEGMRGNKTGKLYPGPFGSGDDDGSQDGTNASVCGVSERTNTQG